MEWTFIEDPTAENRDRAAKELDAISLRLIRARPDDPRVWTSRQIALELQRKLDAAIDANAEALRIDPYNISALAQRGALQMEVGRPENAFQYLDRAIALDPRNPGVAISLWFKCRAIPTGSLRGSHPIVREEPCAQRPLVPSLYLVAAHTQLGDRERAAAAKAELLRRQPECRSRGSSRFVFRTIRNTCGRGIRTSWSLCARRGCPSSSKRRNAALRALFSLLPRILASAREISGQNSIMSERPVMLPTSPFVRA